MNLFGGRYLKVNILPLVAVNLFYLVAAVGK